MFSFNMILDYLPEQIKQLNLSFVACLALIFLLSNIFLSKRSRKVFLLDFACYKPPPTQMCSKEKFIDRFRIYGNSNEASLDFMRKCLVRSGLGEKTYMPSTLMRDPPTLSLEETRKEAESVMFGAVDALLEKTGVNPKDIGIVIATCTILNVEPSLADMIVNRYKLGDHVRVYNFTSMGCSAGLRAIGLAKGLLQEHPNTYALLVSPENTQQMIYRGNGKSKLLMNFPLRVGGAAVLLSNRPSDQDKAKLQLLHSVHTHTASSDSSYNSIIESEDDEGFGGVTVSKELLAVAIEAVEANIRALGPLVLPLSEKIRYLTNYVMIRYLKMADVKPYTPNFKKGIEHVFPHVGTKPVLDEFEKNMGFNSADVEASRMNLYRFGNTCSASVWYALSYGEAKGRIKKGDRLWQIAFGSGFKCSSAVWRALRNVDDHEERNPWIDEIHEFPVDLRNMKSFADVFAPAKKM
uniref:3-ketoacyl-CoA synthase n=1 Tax=Betula platyphylla TaxID=78630 RepID=A0A7D7KM22_BETPL|nr:3-ketoacyl-CoA synthase [Betula platyphylla]